VRVIRHLSADRPAPRDLAGAAVAIGNFDGVHLGHKAVIDRARAYAEAHGLPLVVLTFEPHPRRLFQPDLPPFRLTPLRSKLVRFAALGVDASVVLRFDRTLAATTAEEFVGRYLVESLGARYVAIGENFRFGRGRAGTASYLQQRAAAAGFLVEAVPPQLSPEGEPYASTRIREHLEAGRPEAAASLLGRWFCIDGRIERGDQRGRQIGFPTANVALGPFLRPLRGGYAVFAELGGRRYQAIANLGLRPTFGGLADRFEVHLFDFAGDIYGKRLCVDFVAYLRPEKKFSGLDELKAQIAADSITTRQILSSAQA
jgi:riboflavin kinase/FMN adenylyltransferase